MSEEYVVVNIYKTEEKVEEIPQVSEVSTERREDLRSKLLGMIDEALSLLDKIAPIPGFISEDELLEKRREGRRLRSQVSSASDQDLKKLQGQVETYYYDVKALYEAYSKQAQASIEDLKKYSRKLVNDIRSFLSKASSLFNVSSLQKDVEDLSKKLEETNDISTLQSINHSLETLYNFSKDLSSFIDLYNSLPDDAKASKEIQDLISETNRRISQKNYSISDLLAKLGDIVKKFQGLADRKKRIDELSKKLDDIWNRYQDLFLDPSERKPWVERYSKIKQLLDQALKDPSLDLKSIEDEINKFESDLRSYKESMSKAREENIRQLISKLDDAWGRVRGYLKDPELRRLMSRYNELRNKLEQALKDPSVNMSDLTTAVTSFINELENIYKSAISMKRSEYEREYQKFMTLYNSLKAYMFPIQPPPSPDQVKDYDQALKDLDNYYNMLVDSVKRFAQYSFSQNYREIARLVENYPYRDYILSLLNDYYQKILSISKDNIDMNVISSFYTISNNILRYREYFYTTLAMMNNDLRTQIENNMRDLLKQLGFNESDASLFASSYVSSLSDVSRIYLDPQKSGLLNYIALVYAAYNSGVISRDTFSSILPSNILNIVLKMRQGQDISREEFNELVSWYASNKQNIDRIISILNAESSRNSLMMSQYNLSISSLINGQAPQESPIAVSKGVLDNVLKTIGLVSVTEWLNDAVNSQPIDPQMKWAINNVLVPALIGAGLFTISMTVPGGQILAGVIAVSSLGYMGSQFLDPVLRDQFIQSIQKDPSILIDLVAQIGSAIASGILIGAVGGRSLSALGSQLKLQILESLQRRLPVDSPLYRAISTLVDMRISDAYILPTEREQFIYFVPKEDGSFTLLIKSVEKGVIRKVDSVSADVFKFFGDLIKTAEGKIILSRIAEMIDKKGITSVELTSIGEAKALIGSGDLHGFILIKYGDKEIPIELDLEKPSSGVDLFNVYNLLRGFMKPGEIEDLISKALKGVSYLKISEANVEGKRIPLWFLTTRDNKIVILTPIRSYEASPRDLLMLWLSREEFAKSGLPEGIVEEVLRLSLDSPFLKTLDEELAKYLSELKRAGQMTFSTQNWRGEKITILLQNIELEKSEILSILMSKIETKPGLFSIIPSKYESKSFQVLEIRPKISLDVKTFLERLGLKEGDFVDLNSLRSKISGLIEEAQASGDQAMLSFLKELQEKLDTAIISGMKPQMIITTDSSLTLIFSMNAGSETANAIIQKTQNMIKEVSQVKVLDQATLNNLISKYGYLVSEYLNRFRVETYPKVKYIEKTSIISSSQYQEAIKPERDYIRSIVDVQLKPIIVPRIITLDKSSILVEEAYEEISRPLREYTRSIVDIELRPVVVSKSIVIDKTIPREIAEVEEIVKPQRDYVRQVSDVELKPLVVSKEEYVNQTVSQEQSTYEETIQPTKEETRGIVTVEPIYTPVYAVNVKVTYVPPEEIGEPPVSISKGLVPAPPGMIPQGPQWKEISMPKTEEKRPEKEKVVL